MKFFLFINKIPKWLKISSGVLFILFLLSVSYVLISYYLINNFAKKYLVAKDTTEKVDAIIILGAYVTPDGTPSPMLEDRLIQGYALYKNGTAKKIIVSGDHGKTTYDEVNNMRKYLIKLGMPNEDIFMDHAGFNTYDSLYRAKYVFGVKSAIVVSQDYHVRRAVYIGRALKLNVWGCTSDLRDYASVSYNYSREFPARAKAVVDVIIKRKPKYVGAFISLDQSGEVTQG